MVLLRRLVDWGFMEQNPFIDMLRQDKIKTKNIELYF